MKIAVAGDSAGEGLAKVLADHLKARHEVAEISRTDAGPDAFYANLSDRMTPIPPNARPGRTTRRSSRWARG